MIGVIRQSPLGGLQKVILISYLRGESTFMPAGVKSIAKRVLHLRSHVSDPYADEKLP